VAITTRPYIRCNTCQRKSYSENDIRHRFCGACDKFHDDPSGYTLGSTDRVASPDELHQMANACALYLTQAELSTVVKAFLECNDELMRELSLQHGNDTPITPLDWARIMFTSAHAALASREVDNAIRLFFGARKDKKEPTP
jgi:hypothetical protein